jgi:DNA-binding winged helix-turn-helix (wHTH) protein/Flp pilus assembly protein TadD
LTDLHEFGAYRLDAAKLVLWRDGAIVPLTPKALLLLKALVEQAGEVVPKRELMARVWPDSHVLEANLSVTVAALRKALGSQPDGRPYVQTVPRRGYRLDAALEGAAAGRRTTLAVLPFQGIGAGVDLHLGLGVADALIARLTGVEALRVRPTGAVAHYATAPRPPLAAADELEVDAVIDGTIQAAGRRLLVSVQLVARAGGLPPWAARFEGDADELFALQDEVAERATASLTRRLALAPPAPARAARTPDARAFEACLRGRYFLARFDVDGLARAFGYFGEAAQLDPGYAAPRAGLAAAHVIRGFGGPLPPADAWRAATECAEQALERDPDSTEAHLARGLVALFRDWDWTVVTREIERAVALEPHAPGARLWMGLLLALRGDREGARREVERAREADPVSPLGTTLMSLVHELDGDHGRARELALRAVQSHPDRFLSHLRLGMNALSAGRPTEAIAPLRRAVELTSQGPVVKCALVRALAAAGREPEARAVLDEVETLAGSTWVSPAQRGLAWLALGKRQVALARFGDALRLRDPWVVLLRGDAQARSLLTDGRLRSEAAGLLS